MQNSNKQIILAFMVGLAAAYLYNNPDKIRAWGLMLDKKAEDMSQEELNALLATYVKEENYEKAAEVRDVINKKTT
jgi:hypothetical protein